MPRLRPAPHWSHNIVVVRRPQGGLAGTDQQSHATWSNHVASMPAAERPSYRIQARLQIEPGGIEVFRDVVLQIHVDIGGDPAWTEREPYQTIGGLTGRPFKASRE